MYLLGHIVYKAFFDLFQVVLKTAKYENYNQITSIQVAEMFDQVGINLILMLMLKDDFELHFQRCSLYLVRNGEMEAKVQ